MSRVTLRLVDSTDTPLVHDCDTHRCVWRGHPLLPNGFMYRWLAVSCANARMVKKVEART